MLAGCWRRIGLRACICEEEGTTARKKRREGVLDREDATAVAGKKEYRKQGTGTGTGTGTGRGKEKEGMGEVEKEVMREDMRGEGTEEAM
eukprot:458011-Hanusia_phi.AAC.1